MEHQVTEPGLANQAKLMDGSPRMGLLMKLTVWEVKEKARSVCIKQDIFEIECRPQNHYS